MPSKSRVNAFGSLDEALFAGTDSGIFISRDEARSWQPATGLAASSGRIICFTDFGRKIFAGTDGCGMLASSDKGESWVVNSAFPSKRLRSLLAREGKLYAGTDADGVFASDDGGQSWVQLSRGFPAHAQAFALSMVNGRLFAGLYGKGLYSWNEHEHRWVKAGRVTPLVLAAIDGTLVAGHNPGGLHWSGDLGASWSKGTASAIGSFSSVFSDDSGELTPEAPVWELASNDDVVIAGASKGIYYSDDRGRTWTRARKGLPTDSPGVSFLLKPAFMLAGTSMKGSIGEPDSPTKSSQSNRSNTNRTPTTVEFPR